MTLWFENEYPDVPLGTLFDFDLEKTAEEVASCVLAEEHCPYDTELSLTLVDDARIRAINLEMRGIDAATDVLSFPMVAYSEPSAFAEAEALKADSFDMESGALLLGDIVLSADHVLSQSAAYGHSARREAAFLIAHSMLHLLGYDHMNEEEERVMFAKQEAVLRLLGITRETI